MEPMPPAEDPSSFNAPPAREPYAPQAAKPQSIRQAVLLMYVGAAISLLGGLLALLVTDIDQLIAESTAGSGVTFDASTAKTIVYGTIFVSLALGTGLWIWMAMMNDRGKKWARVVATVFFALAVISSLASFAGTTPTPGFSIAVNVVNLLVGLGAIVLMYRPESSRYYEQMSGPRY